MSHKKELLRLQGATRILRAKLNRFEEMIVTEVSDLQASFENYVGVVQAYQGRVEEDYAESQRLLKEAQDKLGAESTALDALKAHIDESGESLASEDLNPDFPAPPSDEEPPAEPV